MIGMERLRRLVIFVVMLCAAAGVRGQMRQVFVDNTNADNEIIKISFFSASEGYVAFSRWIGYSTDSGRTFIQKAVTLNNVNFNNYYNVNLTFGFGIKGVKAFSKDSVLAYGDYGFVPAILFSSDGCNTFKLIFLSQYDPQQLRTGIKDMVFPQNGNIGYAVDADRVLKTTDRGQTWTMVRNDPASYFEFLESTDDNNVIAFSTGSNSNKIVKTSNGGSSWQQLSIPAGGVLYSHFISPNTGWLNMRDPDQNGNLYYTSNGGASWVRKNDPLVTPFAGTRMRFINDSTGYALSGLFEVYRTSDSGKVWERLPRDNNYSYLYYYHNDLQYRTPAELWAGGGHGFLELNTNPGGITIPSAFFKIDTSNILQNHTVKLLNYSKPGYQYKWYRNDTLIGSAYNSSYVHNIFRLCDTIKLVVSNAGYSDSLIQYQYFYSPIVINSFTPTTGAAGAVITINGYNFSDVNYVSFGGQPATSISVLSSSSLTAVVGAGASGYVLVRSSTGIDSMAGFSFIPPPKISSFSPVTATAGTTITITGTNFTNASSVTFGGAPASSYTVVSATTITAIPGAGYSGGVRVTTPGGTDSLAGFTLLPVMSSFSPQSGSNGTVVTITGTGFGDVTGVSFNGVAARSFVINSPTSITAIVGSGGTGSVSIKTAAGTSSLPGFTYFLAPVIASFTPVSGTIGSTVTITGSNFSPVAAENIVYFGAVQAVVTGASATSLTVTVPAGASFLPITVNTHHLTAWSNRPFSVTYAGGGSITSNSFAPRTDINSSADYAAPYSIAVGDLDGDGKPDMAVTALGGYSVAVLHNRSTNGSLVFDPRVDYPAIDEPNNVFMKDIDGDGKLDMIVTNAGSATVEIFRNTSVPGTISFAPRVDVSASVNAGALAVADIDGDGRPDLIVTNYPDNAIAVLMGNGEAGGISFAAAVVSNINGGNAIAVNDMDGDGKPDLIIEHRTANVLSIARNTSTIGNPSFAATVDVTANFAYAIYSCDIDGDGKPDIVSPDPNGNSVDLIRNTSTGSISFASTVTLYAGNSPQNVYMSDLDGDGKPDLAVAGGIDSVISVFKNTSAPGTLSFADKIDFATGRYPTGIAIEDMDGDGKYDLLTANQGFSTVTLLRSTVVAEPFIKSFTPTIGIAGTTVTITGNNFNAVTAVSFGGVPAASFVVNSSTSITAVVGAGGAGDVAVTNNYGTGKKAGFVFGIPPVISSITPVSGPVGTSVTISGTGFSAVGAENVVYFGKLQATVLSASSGMLVVRAPAAATFDPITVTSKGLTAYSVQRFTTTYPGADTGFTKYSFVKQVEFQGGNIGCVADLDGDGKLDIAYQTSHGLGTISVARNSSSGKTISFEPGINLIAGAFPIRIATGDIDGDGKPDLVVANYEGSSFSVLQNQSSPGVIAFAPHLDFVTGASTTRPQGVAVGDLDGDGKPDIVVANYYSETISVFRNTSSNGVITFASRVDYSPGGYPTGVVIGDLDGDGKPDLALSVNGASGLSIFGNTSIPGNISFGPRIDIATGGSWPEDIKTGDIDGDGKTDITVVLINSNILVNFKNQSSPGVFSFSGPTVLTAGNGPQAVAIGDMDGDGKPDLLEENAYFSYTIPNSISLFKNISSGGNISFKPKFDCVMGSSTAAMFPWTGSIADLDGDGKSDLVIFIDGGPVTVLRNQINEPYIADFVPATAYKGKTVMITGGKLSGATGVRFGGVAAQSFTILSDTSISAVVGEGASGSVMVTIATDSVSDAGFTYIPVPVITPGTSTGCADKGVVLRSSALTGNQWYADGVIISEATADTLLVKKTGLYTVTATVNGVTTPASAGAAITIYAVPKPQVSIDILDSLVSSADAGNQWYVDTTGVIAGATGKKFKPTTPGYYAVKVTQNGCTSAFSDRYHYVATAVINVGGPNSYVSFLPNPARDFVRIDFVLAGVNELEIELSDLNGRQLIRKSGVHAGDLLDITSLAGGMYFIKAYSRSGKINVTGTMLKLR